MHPRPNKKVAFALMTRSDTTNDPTDAMIAATSMLLRWGYSNYLYDRVLLERKAPLSFVSVGVWCSLSFFQVNFFQDLKFRRRRKKEEREEESYLEFSCFHFPHKLL